MRVTLFSDAGGRTSVDVRPVPELAPMPDWQGAPLSRVRWERVIQLGPADVQLVEIAAGGHFVMHASPDLAFCQVVRGRGRLGLPGGEAIEYAGPELFVFLPNSLHDWHAIVEDTLLAVCLVRQTT
jgi:quercetin dioxygenase-like cupin family protein